MTQVTFDTNNDTIEELEEAARILAQAIARKKGHVIATDDHDVPADKTPALDLPPAKGYDDKDNDETEIADEELDAGLFKITLKHDRPEKPKDPDAPVLPTLNDLIHDDRLSEAELSKMFKEHVAKEMELEKAEKEKHRKEKGEDAYIEIIEYTDEKS